MAAVVALGLWFSSINSRELAARREAYLAVLDVAAALEPGVTCMQYCELLIRAHQGVARGEALSAERAQGPFWSDLRRALGSYDKAHDAWHKALSDAADNLLVAGAASSYDYEAVVQGCWQQAGAQLRKAVAELRLW